MLCINEISCISKSKVNSQRIYMLYGMIYTMLIRENGFLYTEIAHFIVHKKMMTFTLCPRLLNCGR